MLNTFLQRQSLIEELDRRGFKPVATKIGWTYRNSDGVVVWFNMEGRFEVDGSNEAFMQKLGGVASSPKTILEFLDEIGGTNAVHAGR